MIASSAAYAFAAVCLGLIIAAGLLCRLRLRRCLPGLNDRRRLGSPWGGVRMNANAFIQIIAVMRAAKCDSIKLENEPFMPLCVEFIGNEGPSGTGRPCVSFCHYGEQNGDLMRDPEVCFEIVTSKDGLDYVFAYSFRNDYAGTEQEVFENVGVGILLNQPLANDINAFALMWSENLIEQGFVDAATRQLLCTPETSTATATASNG